MIQKILCNFDKISLFLPNFQVPSDNRYKMILEGDIASYSKQDISLIDWYLYIFLKSFGLNNQRSSPFIVGINDVTTIFAKPDFLRIIL